MNASSTDRGEGLPGSPSASRASAIRGLFARAGRALTPSISGWIVVGFVVWLLARPLLHLHGVMAAVVDTATVLAVLAAAILIEVSRETQQRDGAPGAGPCRQDVPASWSPRSSAET